jgi:hypothetical protein
MLPQRLRVLYLHGFASSPQSRKARFFAEKLSERGFPVEIPDLAGGDFEHLTISRQLLEVEKAARNEPVVLIGSSLGGYLAALYAVRHPEAARVILLAPAFAFHRLWTTELGKERLDSWREKGSVLVFHYGEGREVPLAFDLMEDAARFEPFPDFEQPGLIFHGIKDTVVPLRLSEEFTTSHPNVKLVGLNSGHELTDVLEEIWRASTDFIEGNGL